MPGSDSAKLDTTPPPLTAVLDPASDSGRPRGSAYPGGGWTVPEGASALGGIGFSSLCITNGARAGSRIRPQGLALDEPGNPERH